MKLSEMNTDQAFACMVRMAPYAAQLVDALAPEKKRVLEDSEASASDAINAFVPLLLSEHKEALYGLLGAMDGKTPEEIERQPYAQTMAIIKGDVTREFFDFFGFAVQLVLHA